GGARFHRLRANDQRRLVGINVHEARGDPAVALFDHLDRDVRADELVVGRQDDRIALDAQAAGEDYRVPFTVIALRILVGLEDADPRLALARHRPRQLHLDVVRVEVGVLQPG